MRHLGSFLPVIVKVRILLPVIFILLEPISINADQVNNKLPSDLIGKGWQEVVFEDKVSNEYSSCGEGCIRVVSQSSVSMVGRRVKKTLTSTSVLSWDWKILKPAPISDITLKGSDDRALALYITFPYDSETASLGERILRPMVELIEGENAAGRMLSYVWAGHGSREDMYRSPFHGAANVMIVKRNSSDPVGKWLHEKVNLVEDYERAFDSKPKEILELLIGADTDDLMNPSIGLVRNLNIFSQ